VSCVLGRGAAVAACGVLFACPASAADPPAPSATSTTTEIWEAPPPRDYDAPDPNRTILTFLRAGANTVFASWFIWQYDWIVAKERVYNVTGPDIANNVAHGFHFDDDPLAANFFGHPYGGGTGFFAAARSTGLSFWESAPYVLGGSLFWEYLSETQYPSTNDVIATTLGGIATGEMLFRLSSFALDDSRTGFARFTRELLSAAIDPGRGANRVATGEAWAPGAPPIRKRARLAAHLGVDRISAGSSNTGASTANPSALFAVDAEYGDVLPVHGSSSIPAYEFFDFYGAAIISTQRASGLELETTGLLHGWSSDLSAADDPDPATRDNHVIGFFQNLDYQGSDQIRFGAFGLGFGDVLVLRGRGRHRFRIGLDVGWAPLTATESTVNPYVNTDSRRNYNISMGASSGLLLRWDIGRFGQIGFRGREYGSAVIDGVRGRELLGHARAWYEIDAIPNVVGIGLASRLMHSAGSFTENRRYNDSQLSLQLYLTARL
jgi:hypothetical protein